MVRALMVNAMKGDIPSIAFIRNMTRARNPEEEQQAQAEHDRLLEETTGRLRAQLEKEGAWDGQETELCMLAETAVLVARLNDLLAAPDFQPVTTDPRTGHQTVSPLIQLRDKQREQFQTLLDKMRTDTIRRKITRKNMKL